MFQSALAYMIGFYILVRCQYSYNLHFLKHFPNQAVFPCPSNHTYAMGLQPHTCVSYRYQCLGVTTVQIKVVDGWQLLCHPNFQLNITNSNLYNNFSINTGSSYPVIIYNVQNQLVYKTDINLEFFACLIVFGSKLPGKVDTTTYNCLYYPGAQVNGDQTTTYQNGSGFFDLGNNTYSTCSNANCLYCDLNSDQKERCNVCKEPYFVGFDENNTYSECKYSKIKFLFKECNVTGGECYNTYEQPTHCKYYGYEEDNTGSQLKCSKCQSNCQICRSSWCDRCSYSQITQDYYFTIYTKYHSTQNTCLGVQNCISYLEDTTKSMTCQQCNLGFYLQSTTSCAQCSFLFANCYHCDSIKCYTCKPGYYLNSGSCVSHGFCDKKCQTCLSNSTSVCTSCYGEKHFYVNNGLCVCDQPNNYYELDGNCVLCTDGVCNTCLTFYDCLSCKPLTNRYLKGQKCICYDGYFDDGDVAYICKKCHPTCATCFDDDLSHCLSCDPLQNRELVKGQCLCITGYGEKDDTYSDLICGECYDRCQSCIYSNDPNSCTQCLTVQNRKLSEISSCLCIDNYGDNDGILDACYICHYSCGSCNGGSKNDCTSCVDTSFRQFTSSNQCNCKIGYFENSFENIVCQSCYYSCKNCNGDSNYDSCTECPITRIPNQDGTVFSCLCKDFNYFDDGVSQECQQCHYSCLSCSAAGPYFCLTCDTSVRKFSNQNCLCLSRTFDDEVSSCQSCHYSCLTCGTIESSNCLSCADTDIRELKSGYCVCQTGYFEVKNQSLCQQCSFRCLTCQDTKDTCLACPTNSFRELGDNQSCSCPSFLYEQADTIVCQKCHLKCLTCYGESETECNSCKELSNRNLINNQCLCKPQFFEVNVEQCSTCSQYCFECQTSFDNCISCQNDRTLVGSRCFCNTKLNGNVLSTYEVNGQVKCENCHYTCLSCNGPTYNKCQSCYGVENRYQDGSQCPCSPGYFDAGVPQCQKCGYQCENCIYSENFCLSCQSNSLRILNIQIKSCTCQPGFYDDGFNSICQACDYQCAQCSIVSSHCLTCQAGSYRQYNDIFFSCDCISGYYDNGNATCQPCHYSCYECTNSSRLDCKSCKLISASNRALKKTECICLSGFYDDGFSANCQHCDVTCKNCQNFAYQCTSCSTTRKLQNQSCNCNDGLYEIGQKECSLCDKNCLLCQFQSKNCIACDTSLFLTLDSSTKSCVCQQGYMQTNGICEKCNSSCLTCQESINNCIDCPVNRALKNNQCFCIDGFFESGNLCQICNKSCLTCQDSESFCLTCSLQNNRKLTTYNTCICLDGYYEQQTTFSCEKCHYSCKTCRTNSQICTSCDTSINLNLEQNKCSCQQGYYVDQNSQSCELCHYSCLTCETLTQCTSCRLETRKFDDFLLKCDCIQGYYDSGLANCLKCDYKCQACQISNENCTSCNIEARRQLSGNKCECTEGYYDVGIVVCHICGTQCKACVDKNTKCTLCYETEQLRQLDNNLCICRPGYFDSGLDVCQKCSVQCKTCIGTSDYCTSCDIDSKRLDHSIIHKCPCIQGFYSDLQGECQKCHIKCESCLKSRDNCLNCNNPVQSNRLLVSNQCNCKQGFYDDNIQLECQKCSTICKTCTQGANNCEECSNNLRSNPPDCKCLDGYFEDQALNCIQCSNQCLTCVTSENNCTTCKVGRINSSCDCQAGSFEAGVEECLACDFQCKECLQSYTNCTSCKGNRINPPSCVCDEGFYDDKIDENCQPCDYTCQTCNDKGCITCNGNRILSKVYTCDPPLNSISYQTTAWCSNCQVAVLLIRFSDDLNYINIKFDFQLKKPLQNKSCSYFLEDETLLLLGQGYSCNISDIDTSIFIITLGQESKIIVDSKILFQQNILMHTNCQQQLTTFIFNYVQVPQNYLEPVIQFDIPINQVSSCVENIIYSKYTNIDGKRKFSYINWSYTMLNSDSNLEEFIQSINQQQQIDLIIPSLTLPPDSVITFRIEVTNFFGISSNTSIIFTTQSDDQPIISTNAKNKYFNYQTINIGFNIQILHCHSQSKNQTPLYQIALIETAKSNDTAASSDVNYTTQSSDSSYSVSIPKYKLTPSTIYYFNLTVDELNTQKSSYQSFSFKIQQADMLCKFDGVTEIQDFKQDLDISILCRDLNTKLDWNTDPDLRIEVICIDLFTSQNCRNQQNQEISITTNSYYQTVSKYSVKPYSVQQWKVTVFKANSNKIFEQIIVFLDEEFIPLQVDFNVGYTARPINNYEVLNFTYQIPTQDQDNVVEMSLTIIHDYSIIQILNPTYYEYQMRLQDYIGTTYTQNNQYNLKFAVQYTNKINPSSFNLEITLNIPPICSDFKQIQSNYNGLAQLDIITNCARSDDSPYQYKMRYLLTQQDMNEFMAGESKLFLGDSEYQMSSKLTYILPHSFENNSIPFVIFVMDQGGSITNLFGTTEIQNNFDCSLVNMTNLSNQKLNIKIASMLQALGQNQTGCYKLKQEIFTMIQTNQQTFQAYNFMLKAIQIFLKQADTSQVTRLLTDSHTYFCFYQKDQNFILNQASNINNESNLVSILSNIQSLSDNFEETYSYLIGQSNIFNQMLQDQTISWDQSLFEQYDELQTTIELSILMSDRIFQQISIVQRIDNEIFDNSQKLLSMIKKITDQIANTTKVNGKALSLDGQFVQWKLQRLSRSQFKKSFGLSQSIEDSVIKFSQKEQISLKLNPYRFSNTTIYQIQQAFNNTTITLDQNIMKQLNLKNFHQSGQSIIQSNFEQNFTILMNQTTFCSNDSSINSSNIVLPICIVIQENSNIVKCESRFVIYNQLVIINCQCSSFGSIILVYQKENKDNTTNSTVSTDQVKAIFSISYQFTPYSPVFISLISYLGIVIIIYMALIFYQKKYFNFDVTLQTHQEIPASHIHCYPGNFITIKRNYKYLHQILQFRFVTESLIYHSFHFIDANIQLILMFLSSSLVNFPDKNLNYLNLLIVPLIGMLFRVLSKILQGIFRLNRMFQIIVGVLQAILFMICVLAAILITNDRHFLNFYNQIIFFIGVIIYQTVIESVIIAISIAVYKTTFQSIRNKEFNIVHHLLYFFAYHERLELEFEQYFII